MENQLALDTLEIIILKNPVQIVNLKKDATKNTKRVIKMDRVDIGKCICGGQLKYVNGTQDLFKCERCGREY